MPPSTFSIVAHDPDEQAWGVAVASKFLAVGAVVSWAQAGAGAVATQSYSKVSFGPDGLALLAQGKSARETLDMLLANDPGAATRQVGIVDARGGSASHTGSGCHAWAGHKTGESFACQGNILTGPEVIEAMTSAFGGASGELADRMFAALVAGDSAGGDRRGRQGAALLVVKANAGYGGDNDRYLDLRVDDDPQPLRKLQQLVQAHHLYFGRTRPEDLMPITEDIARELQHIMVAEGYYGGAVDGGWDETTRRAFWMLVGNENLEERWSLEDTPDSIDRIVLNYLREKFK